MQSHRHRTNTSRFNVGAWLIALLLPGVLLAPAAVRADTFCVGTVGELTNALVLAANLQGNHSVRIRKGVYVMTDDIEYDNDSGGNLAVSGGWNVGCTLRGTDPYETVVGGSDRTWSFRTYLAQINVTVQLLRFVNFRGMVFWDDFPCGSVQKRFRVARVAMETSEPGYGGLSFFNLCHRIEVENTLIVGGDSSVVTEGRGVPMRFAHNTFIGAQEHGLGLYRTYGGASSEIELYNNIVYGHGQEDVHVVAGNVHAITNIWGELLMENAGVLDPNSFGNTTANPELASNGRPIEPGSPAINTGYLSIPGGIPDLDIEGNDRLVGNSPDRGAFETSVSDSTLITVTDPNDSGPGTLRQAILTANASPGPKAIQFNIPGACPQSIFLQSPLPLLTTDALLTINGYSQSGSNSNTLEHGNDATICIHLRKSSSIQSLPYALSVPPSSATTLRLRGIGFGGVGDAVQLSGGDNHLVQGNRFGDTLVGNSAAVKIFSGSSGATIGGSASTAHRNTIADSNVVGILVVGSNGVEISNNYIGTNSDGLSPAGNSTGISVSHAAGTRIISNVISGNLGAGVVLSGAGTVQTTIAGNRIGIIRESIVRPSDLGNGDAGIRITNAASDNRIGGSFRGSGNIIANNTGPGIAIASGQRNTVERNSIYANAGLGIDLADEGVTPNDDDSAGVPLDFANRGLNFPILSSALGSESSGVVHGSISSTRGGYRIEIFMNSDCDASGHGEGSALIGATDVLIPNMPGQLTVAFSASIQSGMVELAGQISATATDTSGNTSEFSACIPYVHSDLIFADGFEE